VDLQAISEIIRPYWVVWLLILFLGVLFYAFRPKNKDRFESDGQIPFKNDE